MSVHYRSDLNLLTFYLQVYLHSVFEQLQLHTYNTCGSNTTSHLMNSVTTGGEEAISFQVKPKPVDTVFTYSVNSNVRNHFQEQDTRLYEQELYRYDTEFWFGVDYYVDPPVNDQTTRAHEIVRELQDDLAFDNLSQLSDQASVEAFEATRRYDHQFDKSIEIEPLEKDDTPAFRARKQAKLIAEQAEQHNLECRKRKDEWAQRTAKKLAKLFRDE